MSGTSFTIRNDIELTLALDRAEELMGCIDDTDEALELAEICEAIEVYTDSMQVLRLVDANPNKTDPFASRD